MRATTNRLLGATGGLGCLPAITKDWLRQALEEGTLEENALARRLGFLEKTVEPFLLAPANGGNLDLASFAADFAEIRTAEALEARLQIDEARKATRHPLRLRFELSEGLPAKQLFRAAVLYALPPTEAEALGLHLRSQIADTLWRAGNQRTACALEIEVRSTLRNHLNLMTPVWRTNLLLAMPSCLFCLPAWHRTLCLGLIEDYDQRYRLGQWLLFLFRTSDPLVLEDAANGGTLRSTAAELEFGNLELFVERYGLSKNLLPDFDEDGDAAERPFTAWSEFWQKCCEVLKSSNEVGYFYALNNASMIMLPEERYAVFADAAARLGLSSPALRLRSRGQEIESLRGEAQSRKVFKLIVTSPVLRNPTSASVQKVLSSSERAVIERFQGRTNRLEPFPVEVVGTTLAPLFAIIGAPGRLGKQLQVAEFYRYELGQIHEACLILEHSLELAVPDYPDSSEVEAGLEDSLLHYITDPTLRLAAFRVVAETWAGLEKRGPRAARVLMELGLGLGREWSEADLDPQPVYTNWFQGVQSPDQCVNAVVVFAFLLQRTDATRSALSWLLAARDFGSFVADQDARASDLVNEALSGVDGAWERLKEFEKRLDGVPEADRVSLIEACSPVSRLSLMRAIIDGSTGAGSYNAGLDVLGAVLEGGTETLRSLPDAMRAIESSMLAREVGLGFTDVFVRAAAGLLAATDERRAAQVLIDAWTALLAGREAEYGAVVDLWSDRPHVEELSVLNRLEITQKWLGSTDHVGAVEFEVCDATVRYIHRKRDEDIRGFLRKAEFADHCRQTLWTLRKVAFEALRSASDGTRETWEVALMEWSEVLQNRLILSRALQASGIDRSKAIAIDLDASDPWPWAERVPGFERTRGHHRARPEAVAYGAASLPDAGEQEDESLGWAELKVPPPTTSELLRRSNLALDLYALADLVPPGATVVKALFDDRGCLWWWAFESGAKFGSIRILARWTSAPGAEYRLGVANARFDLRVEALWAQHTGNLGVAEAIERLRGLPAHLLAHERGVVPPIPRELDQNLAIIACDCPMFSSLVSWLLRRGPGESDPPSGDEVVVWAQELSAILEMWPVDPRKRPRRRELRDALENATSELREELGHDFNLAPLEQALGVEVDPCSLDIVFQVERVLYSLPLCLTPFMNRELYRSVASTSTVVSLAHVAVAGLESRGPAKTILSAHYLGDREWHSSCGLARLHRDIVSMATGSGWNLLALGHDPPASVENIQGLLNREDGTPGLLVIGGHGDPERAGVVLADGEAWSGEGADLSRLDLIVFAACSVGRLSEFGMRDVEGLTAEVLAHGGRSMVAARWPVSDLETADLLRAFLREYLHGLERSDSRARTFFRARALNKARQECCTTGPVTQHVGAAFEIFGLG